MTDEPVKAVEVNKFPITSIEITDPPEGVEGEWYEYVIGKGSSSIKGRRAGTLQAVTEYVEEYAENLNQRSTLGYSSYAARKVQKTPAKTPPKVPPTSTS
jgi:hypothetical protein